MPENNSGRATAESRSAHRADANAAKPELVDDPRGAEAKRKTSDAKGEHPVPLPPDSKRERQMTDFPDDDD